MVQLVQWLYTLILQLIIYAIPGGPTQSQGGTHWRLDSPHPRGTAEITTPENYPTLIVIKTILGSESLILVKLAIQWVSIERLNNHYGIPQHQRVDRLISLKIVTIYNIKPAIHFQTSLPSNLVLPIRITTIPSLQIQVRLHRSGKISLTKLVAS